MEEVRKSELEQENLTDDGDESSSSSSTEDLEGEQGSSLVERRLLSFYEHQLEEKASHRKVVSKQQRRVTPSSEEAAILILHKPHAYPCKNTHQILPTAPSSWPQRPIMWRPTPNTCTNIRGIRYASSKLGDYQHFKGFCAGCILPINNGREPPGKSLVIDFESNLFVGTILLRLRQAPPINRKSEQNTTANNDYFENKKRTFQCVVKGKFKRPLDMSDCVTGQCFRRPAKQLPARWIVTNFIQLISKLAPQLEASVDGDEPRFLTPLAATAQTVLVKACAKETTQQQHDDDDLEPHSTTTTPEERDQLSNIRIYAGAHDMEAPLEEPAVTDPTSLLFQAPLPQCRRRHHKHNKKSVTTCRQKARKKAFNRIQQHDDEPSCAFFQVDKEYTFEFYQHMLLFGKKELALDMSLVGQVDLAPILDGQPIQCMAAHRTKKTKRLETLWSFDIWHDSLYELARDAEE